MNQLERYFRYQGEGVRIVIQNDEPWFVARDVTDILGIDRTQARSLPEHLKGMCSIHTPGGKQEALIINESGLYRLVLRSRKPEAEKFQVWVTEEVLPTIRRTGTYSTQIPQTYPEALRLAADLAEENQRLLPKAQAHDLFLAADNAQPMNVVAKSLGTGRDRLFKFLRERKVLMASNVPYQPYLERGYFKVIEKSIQMGDQVINKPQTLVTSRGVDYIGRLLKGVTVEA